MQLNSSEVKFIIGDETTIQNMNEIPAFPPFDPIIINYLDTVSRLLLADSGSKLYPDVVTFAFWCRKASILSMQNVSKNDKSRIGRGVVFHIAPSNVAVNFAYSLVVGLLSGNANIMRIPSKDFEQVRLICNALRKALNNNITPYLCLLQYGHNQEVNDYLSLICDVRIIWGGDQTINAIRISPLKPRASEITFADRYSICIINSDEYLKANNIKEIAIGFYNDTYLTDQNACTSPRIVIWTGDNINEAQNIFWNNLTSIVEQRYDLQPVQAIYKYTNMCKHSALNERLHFIAGENNYIFRVNVEKLYKGIMEYKGNSGYFMEYYATSLDEIIPLCTSQCQTISYFGLDADEIRNFIKSKRPRGIDRVVPIGKTMDFSLTWDGYDLISNLTRIIA